MPQWRIVNELAPTPGYAHVATLAPGEQLVVTAGAVPLDEKGRLVGPGDFQAQTAQVLKNLSKALQAVDSDLRFVVKTTVYVVAKEGEDLSTVWRIVRTSELSERPHASTLVGVSLLGFPDQLVEIEAVACGQFESR